MQSLKENLWFGKGVASALTELDLASTQQYCGIQFNKVADKIGVKLPGLLSV